MQSTKTIMIKGWRWISKLTQGFKMMADTDHPVIHLLNRWQIKMYRPASHPSLEQTADTDQPVIHLLNRRQIQTSQSSICWTYSRYKCTDHLVIHIVNRLQVETSLSSILVNSRHKMVAILLKLFIPRGHSCGKLLTWLSESSSCKRPSLHHALSRIQ